MPEVKNGYKTGKFDSEYWMEQWRLGIAFRKKYAQEAKWGQWRNYYRGNWASGVLPTNIYFKMIRTLVPRIYYRNPSVSIIPTKPGIENTLFAKMLESIDNKMIDIMGLKKQMKLAVQNAVMFGTGGCSLGFGSQYAPAPDMLDSSPGNAATRKSDNFVEYNSNIRANMPWVLSTHPGDIVVPTACGDFDTARWNIQHVKRPLADLIDDDRFDNTKGLMDSKSSFSIGDMKKNDNQKDMVDLLVLRDKKTRRVIVFAPYGPTNKKVLLDEEDTLQVDGGLPFYPLVFNADDEVCWGVPDSQIIEPQQREANETRTLIMRHRRISIVKLLVKHGAMSADEESKMIGEEVAAIIKISGDPNVDFRVLEPGAIPQALIESGNLIAQEVQEILGLGVNQFGEYAPGSADRSATEANIVHQATQIRIDERRDMVADMLTNIIKDMHHVIFEQWQNEIVVDIAGPQGVPIWIKFRPEILKDARYDVRTDPDTSLPETKQLREQRAVQFYQLLLANPLINPISLTQGLLNSIDAPGFGSDLMTMLGNTSAQNAMRPADVIQTLQNLPAPTQEQMGQWLQMQAKQKALTENPNLAPK